MIKAIRNTSDGPVIYLGITPENVVRLRQNDPILFPMSDVNIDRKGNIAIVWDTPEWRRQKAKMGKPPCPMVVFVLDDVALERMQDLYGTVSPEGEVYILFLRDTVEDLQAVLQPGISDTTTMVGPDEYVEWSAAQGNRDNKPA